MNAIGPSDGDPTTSSPPERVTRPTGRVYPGAETHEEIVRVLIVNQRGAAEGLARLKHLRRSDVAKRERFERQHRRHDHRSARSSASPRRHQPVLRFPGVEIAELAVLVVEPEERVRVDRPLPRVTAAAGAACDAAACAGMFVLRRRGLSAGHGECEDDQRRTDRANGPQSSQSGYVR